MSLYTCPRCYYTFISPDKPAACPDCGHLQPQPASEVEFNSYYSAQLSLIREKHAPDMTMDERNWSLILLFLNKPKLAFYTSHLIRHYILDATAELCLDTYKGFRWEFTRRFKEDRISLQLAGCQEPKTILRRDDGTPLVKGWEHYGDALRLLYCFESAYEHRAPNLGNINRINLEQIVSTPSGAYIQFLRDWLDEVKDITEPDPLGLPEVKPLLKLIRNGDLTT